MADEQKDNFWKPKSIDQLTVEQGIKAPQSLDKLAGAVADFWASDEDFEQFLSSIDRHRREATSA